MEIIHDVVKALEGVKELLIALASTLSIAAVCVKVVRDKFKPKE